MIRNFKVLGLALVAMLAMSAVAASGASAAKVTAEGGVAAHINGADEAGKNSIFTGAFGIAVTCTTTSYTSSVPAGGTEELVVTPSYSGCTSGARGATVTLNGCTYKLKDATASGGEFTVKSDLVCPAGPPASVIEVHIYNNASHASGTWCTLTIGAQNERLGLKAKNEAGNIKLSGTVGSILTQPHGTCSAGTTINFNGSLDTFVEASGEVGGVPKSIHIG